MARKRNPMAKALEDGAFQQRVVKQNRRRRLNEILEEEAEEEIEMYLNEEGTNGH